MSTTSYIEFVFNLLVHLSVLWWFLTSFFFLYVRYIESQKIYEQLDGYIGKQVHHVMQAIHAQRAQTITLSPSSPSSPSSPPIFPSPTISYGQAYDDLERMLNASTDEDIVAIDKALEASIEANVNLSNERVLTRAIAIGIAFTGITLFYYAWFRDSISLTDILVENVMVFALIGTFEYIFFTRYGIHYEPVDPNEMLRIVRDYKAKKTF